MVWVLENSKQKHVQLSNNELVCQNKTVLEIEMHAMMEFVKIQGIGALPNLSS